jgi:hypothetical protein
MSLEVEILNVINSQLPAQVGEALKKRLVQAEKDAADVEVLRKEICDVKKELIKAQATVSTCRDMEARIKDMTESAQKLRDAQTDAAIIKLKEEHAAARVSDMKDVVLAVFANSKLKYQENLSGPGKDGSWRTTTVTGEAER